MNFKTVLSTIILTAVLSFATITIKESPTIFYGSSIGSSITYEANPEIALTEIQLYSTPTPQSYLSSLYTPLTISSSIPTVDSIGHTIFFTPPSTMEYGLYFLRVTDSNKVITSNETPYIIGSSHAPEFLNAIPVDISLNNSITWSNTGAPAYHLLLSTKPFSNISDPSYFIANADIVWETITHTNNITLTSGHGAFEKLTPHTNYYLLIANNYDGTSSLYTDYSLTSAQTIRNSLTIEADTTRTPHFVNMQDTLSLAKTNFQWECENIDILSFSFTLTKKSSIMGIETSETILKRVTTQKFYSLSLDRYITAGSFTAIVHALDSNGTLAESDTLAFVIPTDSTNTTASPALLQIALQELHDGIASPIEEADITITSLNNGIPIVITTGSHLNPFTQSGYASTTIEEGLYAIKISKQGYNTYTSTIYATSAPLPTTITLTRVMQTLSGSVVDPLGMPIIDATISIVNNSTQQKHEYTDFVRGAFYIPITSGVYTISIASPHAPSQYVSEIIIDAQSNHSLGEIQLTHHIVTVSGIVTQSTGEPISGAKITVKDRQNNFLTEIISRYDGKYSTTIPPGTYTLSVSKGGFGSITLNETIWNDRSLTHTLSAQFNIIEGVARIRRDITLDSALYVVTPFQPIWIISQDTAQDTLWTMTNEQGFYSISVPQTNSGAPADTFFVGSSYSEFDVSDISDPIIFDAPYKTVTAPLEFYFQATISGSFVFADSTNPSAEGITVNLIDTTSLQLFTAKAIFKDSLYAYSFYDIPRGTYSLAISSIGYQLTAPLLIDTLANVIPPRKEYVISQVSLSSHAHTMTISTPNALSLNAITPAHIHLHAPINGLYQSDSINTIPNGHYLFDVYPLTDTLLPILNVQKSITTENSIQTPLKVSHNSQLFQNIPFPAAPAATILSSDSIDSGFVYCTTINGTITDTIISQQKGTTHFVTTFKMPSATSFDSYYFEVYSNNILYSNRSEGRRYRTSFTTTPSTTLLIESSVPDTIHIGRNQSILIPLFIYSSEGINLNTQFETAIAPTALTISWTMNNPAYTFNDTNKTWGVLTTNSDSSITTISATATNGKSTVSKTFVVHVHNSTIHTLSSEFPESYSTHLTSSDTISLNYLGRDTIISISHPITPTISLSPSGAGTISKNSITLSPTFIGDLYITAQSGFVQRTDTLNVKYPLLGNATGLSLFHDSLVQLMIPDSLLTTNGYIALTSKSKRQLSLESPTQQLYSDYYSVHYPLLNHTQKSPILKFTIPEDDQPDQHDALYYNDSSNIWLQYTTEPPTTSFLSKIPASTQYLSSSDSLIELSIESGRYNFYGLSNASKLKSIPELAITPNPFSPYVTASNDGNLEPGTRIDFYPYDESSAHLQVSITIYNMAGERIRQLIYNNSFPTEPQSIYWDGLTDSGRMARNGRYLLRFTTKTYHSNSLIQNVLQSVVVFK